MQFRPWRECRRVQLVVWERVKFFFFFSSSLVVIIPKASFEELGALSLRSIYDTLMPRYRERVVQSA